VGIFDSSCNCYRIGCMLTRNIFTSNCVKMRYSDAIMHQVNWDNLRYVLVVAEKGSIAAAARELGVNRTTVLRRINTFQDNLNCRIFERGDSGYILTPEAEKMIDAAREVENTLFNMQRQIAGRELRLEGELRVTTTDTLIVSVIGPHLASFHRKHPHIVVNVVMTNNILDLSRRDADVAVRPTKTPEGNLIGQRLADIHFGIYASPEYLSSNNAENLRDHSWVGFETELQSTLPGLWLDANIPTEKICLRGDSFIALKVASENAMGLSLLPNYLGDSSEILEKLPIVVDELNTGLWLITHPDLNRSAKVHAFMDHFTETFGKSSVTA
jgi:DNA-binding transcriptional LysR family regulator